MMCTSTRLPSPAPPVTGALPSPAPPSAGPGSEHRSAPRSRPSMTPPEPAARGVGAAGPVASPNMVTTDESQVALRQRALDVLCSSDLGGMVEMVLSAPSPDTYEARSEEGSVRFRRTSDGRSWRYHVVASAGRDPLADQGAGRFAPLSAELASQQPSRSENSYPSAFERIAQVFDHPCAPDLCVLHTAAHRPSSHRGEHGSLGVVQSRAPLIVWGAGIRQMGLVDRHCRLVDIAPTVLAMLGVRGAQGVGPTGDVRPDMLTARQDGSPLLDLMDPHDRAPAHVVVILLDGANPNVLYDAASSGAAPNVANMIDGGTAFAHGALASLPTVTLANHTTLLTGAHPGHHGVLHNAWYDRSLQRQVVTESPSTWQEAMQWLLPGVETVHEALHRHRPGTTTVSVNEPADRGADYSTFDLFRRGETARLAAGLPDPPPHTDGHFLRESSAYRWGSLVDAAALRQATSIWGGEFLDRRYEPPTFCWISFTLTDSAMHEGGPHSEIARASVHDADARIGAVVDAVEKRGVLAESAFVVVADHGMEQNSPECSGDWGDALRRAGIEHRDEASGFLYLGDRPDPG